VRGRRGLVKLCLSRAVSGLSREGGVGPSPVLAGLGPGCAGKERLGPSSVLAGLGAVCAGKEGLGPSSVLAGLGAVCAGMVGLGLISVLADVSPYHPDLQREIHPQPCGMLELM
jgi:hypothetical protein